MEPSRQEIQKIWDHFEVGSEDPIALRFICPKGVDYALPTLNITFNCQDFPDVEDRKRAFEDEALRRNVQGYNVYHLMNVIDPAFKGNLHNGLAVKDVHILARRYLLIDFDREDTKQPASMDELQEVAAVAREVARHLRSTYGYKPLRVFSGNGFHLYLPLDNLPNTPETRDFCHTILLGLAKQFNTEHVKVDTGVANASRITKLPGTIARKGLESEGRKYQIAGVL